MPRKTVVHPEAREAPFGVWSPAIVVESGRMAFLSGSTSRDPSGAVVGRGDIEAQTRQVCENLKVTVEACGGSLEDIVAVTVFVKDIELFDQIHKVRREYFPVDPPTSTMVQVVRFVHEDSMIEMNAIAVLS